MFVKRGNYERYLEQSHLVKGVGRTSSGALLIEIQSATRGRRYLVRVSPGFVIEHVCEAARNGRPCWHLAAAVEAVGAINGNRYEYPVLVETGLAEPEPEEVLDVTQRCLGRPGDFSILNVSKEAPPEEEPAPVLTDVPEEDAWLAGFGFPEAVFRKVLAFREKQRSRLSPEQVSSIPEANYVPVGQELVRSVAALLYGEDGTQWEPVLLKGPRGTGKSTLADTIGAVLMLPVVRITGGIDVNAEWLLGSRTLAYDEDGKQKVVHEPGLLLQAVQDGALLIVEEVNMLLPEVTSLLHSLLDWQRVLPVPGVGHVKPPESFRLVACMNVNYAGTRQLNEAFKDRFREIKVPYLPEGMLARMISSQTGLKEEIARSMAKIFHTLADRVENGDVLEEALSIRALMRAGREIQDGMPAKDSVLSNLCEGIDDPYTAQVVKEVVDSRM